MTMSMTMPLIIKIKIPKLWHKADKKIRIFYDSLSQNQL